METTHRIATDLIVVGAGIAGLSTALEAAETGLNVILIEKNPYIGGRVVQLNQYFPKLCPPTCGMEINIKRLRDNANIRLLTLTEVESIQGKAGDYKTSVKINPRYINQEAPNLEDAAIACNLERKDDFNFGLNNSKVIYIPYNNAYPMEYVLDKDACTPEQLKFLKDSYPDVIDLEQKAEHIEIQSKSIVWASGWDPYDAKNLDILGYGKYPEVITNLELERISAANGPYGGIMQFDGVQSDGPETVVFVQCAGSRDENHLEYCSTICCMASLKQSRYIREQYQHAEIYVYYIDIRTPGVYEEFFTDSKKDPKLHFQRGKVAKIFKPEDIRGVIVEAENTLTGELTQMHADLVILATGMKPNTAKLKDIFPELLDRNGFFKAELEKGIVGCGVCTRPKDVASSVQESTGAAIKAIHTIREAK